MKTWKKEYPGAFARMQCEHRRRSSLQDGVIVVRFIKVLSEPERPHCEISNCQEEANYHYNGGHYCAQHRPAPDYCGPERPEQWTTMCNLPSCEKMCAPNELYCSAEHWQASLTPPSPQWPGGAA